MLCSFSREPTKAYDPGAFAIEIQRYNLIPWIPGALAAVYLPWLEILVGALLVLKRFEQGALLLITCLLIVFTFALASATFRGLGIDCGCFGKAFAATGTIFPLVRNVLLLALQAFFGVAIDEYGSTLNDYLLSLLGRNRHRGDAIQPPDNSLDGRPRGSDDRRREGGCLRPWPS